jgi:hypothetical protein
MQRDIKSYTEEIHALEQQHDVNQFQHDGLNIWPLIRYHYLLKFKHPEEYETYNKTQAAQLFGFKKWRADRGNSKIKKANWSQFIDEVNELQSSEVLLYTRKEEYKDEVNGKSYNKFIDPYFDYFQEKGIGLQKLELYGGAPSSGRLNAPQLLNEAIFGNYFRSKDALDSVVNSAQLNSTFEWMDQNADIVINKDRFHNNLKAVYQYEELFTEVLKQVKPKHVFMAAYYASDTFGLILACRKLGITTIDVQHGKQGTFHPVYSHWTKIPEAGYDLLPDYFWNWGKESKDNIDKWFPTNAKHRCVVGGNLWLGKWKNTDFYQPDTAGKSFIDGLATYKKVILFSLQPIESGMMPEHVKQTIENSPEDWCWLLRLHPSQLKIKPELEDTFQSMKNVEIEEARRLPLYYLLRHANHHITCWSSVCVEALQFDVPTTIVHSTGEMLFENYIEKGMFTAAKTTQELTILISNSEKKAFNDDYLLSDTETMESAMKQMMN